MKRLIEVDRREEREVWNGGNGVVFESAGETTSAHVFEVQEKVLEGVNRRTPLSNVRRSTNLKTRQRQQRLDVGECWRDAYLNAACSKGV